MPLLVFMDAFAFANGWLDSAQRYFQMAKALQELGWDAAVVAQRDSGRAAREVDEAFPGQVMRVPFRTVPLLLDHRGLRYCWGVTRRWFGRRTPADEIWSRRLARWAGRYKPESPLLSADLLCAVSYFSWGPAIATRAMAKELGIPYWIDIQDPLKGTMGQGEPLLSEEQRRSLSDAAQIVTTTATYTRHLQEALPEHADKIKCLRITHNASSSFASDRALQDGRLSLLHAGHLYGRPNRSAAPLLEGIARLYETVPWARGKVTLRLVGKGRGMSEALAWASELGLRQDLECLPPIHPEALQTLLDTADVLCVLKAVEMHRDYQLPGKTYDYLFSSKPILAVTFPGELATIIAETGSGFAVDPTDTERLASILEQLLTQKRAVGSVILERDAGKLSPYSFDAFRETLATILRACAIARTGLPSGTETAKTPEERLFTR